MLYLFDPTRKNDKGETAVYTYNTPKEVISHLENICERLLGKSRNQLMQDAGDLGFGTDDKEGQTFFQFMEEYVNMGVVRKDGQPVRCNIFTVRSFEGKSEYGD